MNVMVNGTVLQSGYRTEISILKQVRYLQMWGGGLQRVSKVCPVLEAEINMKRVVIFKQIRLQAAERHFCSAGVCTCVFRKSLCSHYLTSLQKAGVNSHTHKSDTCIGASALVVPSGRMCVCTFSVSLKQLSEVRQLLDSWSSASVALCTYLTHGVEAVNSPVTAATGLHLVCLVSGGKHLWSSRPWKHIEHIDLVLRECCFFLQRWGERSSEKRQFVILWRWLLPKKSA